MHTPLDNVITEKGVIITNDAKTLHFKCAVNGRKIYRRAFTPIKTVASRRSPNWPRPGRRSWTTRVGKWTSAPSSTPIPTEPLRLLSLSWFSACARDFVVTCTINKLTLCLCKDSQHTLLGVCRGDFGSVAAPAF